MPDSHHRFAGRLVNIAVTGSLVRLELGTMHLSTAEGRKPHLVPSQTLVVPLEGFMQFGMIERVVTAEVSYSRYDWRFHHRIGPGHAGPCDLRGTERGALGAASLVAEAGATAHDGNDFILYE